MKFYGNLLWNLRSWLSLEYRISASVSYRSLHCGNVTSSSCIYSSSSSNNSNLSDIDAGSQLDGVIIIWFNLTVEFYLRAGFSTLTNTECPKNNHSTVSLLLNFPLTFLVVLVIIFYLNKNNKYKFYGIKFAFMFETVEKFREVFIIVKRSSWTDRWLSTRLCMVCMFVGLCMFVVWHL